MKAVAWALALLACAASAQQHVDFDSLDRDAGGASVRLSAQWFPTAATPAPAAVLLHGCGGAYDGRGRLGERMREYAALLNELGYHALVVDSFGPRAVREVCTYRAGTAPVTQAHRRLDALAALDWLAARTDVKAGRIGLIGWSHGGSTVLAASNLLHREVARAAHPAAFAVAFYPGCAAELQRGYRAVAPLLLMIGEADDWTSPQACRLLATRAGGAPVEFHAFAGAPHGFDGTAPVRLRSDVPGGVSPGAGVHVGGDPAARGLSRELLTAFLARQR